jgi:hypothetical protein
MILLYVLGAIWSAPNTIVGLLCTLLGARYRERVGVALVYEVRQGSILDRWMRTGGFGGLVSRGIAAATCGQVVAVQPIYLADQRIIRHETRHVVQGFWLGPLHGPAYLLCCLWAWLCGGDPYTDNALERDARAHE